VTSLARLSFGKRNELWGRLQMMTTPEQPAQSLVSLAAGISDMPCAILTIIDEGRLRHVARVGAIELSVDAASSLCAHVVASVEPVIVSDARSERDLAASPDVAGPPGVRSYAGIPVRSRAGAALGVLSICDQRVRSLEPGSVRMLGLLSRQAGVLLESMDQMERFELLNRMFPPCPRCRRRDSVATEWAQVGGYYTGKVCARCLDELNRE
jgi:GAF domain-containing protein